MGLDRFGVNRNSLQNWASKREAQSEFPRLIRRLIFETSPSSTELGMPAGDGVAAGGWDGTVQTSSTIPWVPDGKSVWELSVNQNPKLKADSDYSKRDSPPGDESPKDFVYVAAILRPWTERESWAAEKRKTGFWKDVRALGLDDVEAWLEQAPVTSAWFAELLGNTPYGYRSGERWWDNWSEQTKIALTPELVLAGRAGAVKSLGLDREHGDPVMTIAAPSDAEALAFLVSAALQLGQQGHGKPLSQLAIVDDLQAWRRLVDSSNPLILIPRGKELLEEIPRKTHHRILVPVLSDEDADIVVPSLSSSGVAEILRGAGFDFETADALGALGRCSLTAMRRSLALNKALHRPGWADSGYPKLVRRLLLAGTWRDDVTGDKSVIAELTGYRYENFKEEAASSLTASEDPFMMRTGDTWHIVSAVDTWMFLAGHFTDEDLNRFRSVVLRVLTEPDPKLELPTDQRWMAAVHGKRRKFSYELRRGLAQSLALLGTYGERVVLNHGLTGARFANILVRDLLAHATADESQNGWKSISDILPYLAEAGPEAFLNEVEDALIGEKPVLTTIFGNGGDDADFLSSSSEHTGLLWSLECVSWAPDHFARSVDLLAILDEIDPGGRTSNRPANSLAAIFRPWHPDSSVSADRRLAVLDSMRRKHPEASWQLLIKMLPERSNVHFPIYSPSFRLWKPDNIIVSKQEWRDVTDAVVDKCIKDAGIDPNRWTLLLDHYNSLHHGAQGKIIDALNVIGERKTFTEKFGNAMWQELNELIGKHRSHPGSQWAISDSELSNLIQAAAPFCPKSPVDYWMGLFCTWDPYIGISVTDDTDKYMEELGRLRADAIQEIAEVEGTEGVTKLARDADVVGSVGGALAKAGLEYDKQLLEWITDENGKLVENARSFFTTNYKLKGFPYIQKFLSMEDLSDKAKARLLLLANDDFESAWRWGDDNPNVMAIYWSEFSVYGLGQNLEQVIEIGSSLLQAKRPSATIKLMLVYSHVRRRSIGESFVAILVQALEMLLKHQHQGTHHELNSYDLQSAFDHLESNRELVEVNKLIRLEWAYLPALGHDAVVPTLYQWLSETPEAFVGILSLAYKTDPKAPLEDDTEDSHSDDEASKARASQAYSLLQSWNTPPGLVNGSMDGNVLNTWIDSVKPQLDECYRTSIGMHVLGGVLYYSPKDPDGTWPGRVVRDFLEERRIQHIEDGFYFRVLNSRGVTSRSLDEGGKQEEELASEYREIAVSFADEWPRVAKLFREISQAYETDARREEVGAERHRRGLRW